MKSVAVLFLLIVAWATARGQVAPVGGNLTVTPGFVKAVVGLTFNTTTHQQEGNFSVSVDMGTPPTGDVYLYGWSSLNDALVFDDPSAASTTAHASGTGIYFVTCSVSLVRFGMSGGLPSITLIDSGIGSSECAAIGGPIGVTVGGNENPTYSHDKNDKTKSWYMTFYDTGSEHTHDATMTIPDQPKITRDHKVKGTTITWTLPESTATADPTTTPIDPQTGIGVQPLSVVANATGDFQDGTPKIKFHFNDGVISGDADDDSADFQDVAATDSMGNPTA